MIGEDTKSIMGGKKKKSEEKVEGIRGNGQC